MTIAIGAACRPSDRREARDFERMRRQQRYNAYDTSAFFANGATMQAPPMHTIPRDLRLAAAGQTAAPAVLTGRSGNAFVADLPIAVDDSVLAHGAQQYAISCAPCHGAGGFGGGPIAPNLRAKRPPSLRTPPVSSLSAGLMFSAITDGFGAMPPYGWQLPIAARWAVVAHVQRLASQPMTAATRSDSLLADYLRQLDSLQAAHASLAAIVAFRKRAQ
jgi:mono/diheme cytochrome c family protein